MDQALNSQKTPHTSPLRASYGMSFVSILMKNDRVIKGFYCSVIKWQNISRQGICLNKRYSHGYDSIQRCLTGEGKSHCGDTTISQPLLVRHLFTEPGPMSPYRYCYDKALTEPFLINIDITPDCRTGPCFNIQTFFPAMGTPSKR